MIGTRVDRARIERLDFIPRETRECARQGRDSARAVRERDEEGETRPIGIIPTSHRDLCRLWDYAGISRQSLFSVVLHEIRDKAESQAAFPATRPWRPLRLFRDFFTDDDDTFTSPLNPVVRTRRICR